MARPLQAASTLTVPIGRGLIGAHGGQHEQDIDEFARMGRICRDLAGEADVP